MSEERFILCQDDLGNYEIRYDDNVFHFLWEVAPILNEQQATINKLRKILAEAEDTIEVRLAEHYLKEYENIKHNIIGDNDE